MTKDEDSRPVVKRGRKDKAEKKTVDQKLREIYDKGGVSPYIAAKMVGCGYKYAYEKFDKFGIELVDTEEEDWVERNDKVRKRELQSLSLQIVDSEKKIKLAQDQVDEHIQFQKLALEESIDELNDTPEIRQALGELDPKTFMILLGILRKSLDIHKSYGFLLVSSIAQLRAERTFNAELHQQYAAIEILPPPKALIEAALEKYIAARTEKLRVAVPGEGT